jgi:hypothetical protein
MAQARWPAERGRHSSSVCAAPRSANPAPFSGNEDFHANATQTAPRRLTAAAAGVRHNAQRVPGGGASCVGSIRPAGREQSLGELEMPLRLKHVVRALLPCLGLVLPAYSHAAAEPRYTYGELGYVNADYDDINEDGDGFTLGGSYALTRNFHLLIDYTDIDLDSDDDASILAIGAGVNFPLRAGLDAVGRARYIDAEIDRQGDDSESGFGLEAGVRTMINSQLELNGGIRYTDVYDDNTSLVIGGLFDVVSNVALGGEFEYADDYTALVLKARVYFAPPWQLR